MNKQNLFFIAFVSLLFAPIVIEGVARQAISWGAVALFGFAALAILAMATYPARFED